MCPLTISTKLVVAPPARHTTRTAQTPTARVVTPHTVFKPTARYRFQDRNAARFSHKQGKASHRPDVATTRVSDRVASRGMRAPAHAGACAGEPPSPPSGPHDASGARAHMRNVKIRHAHLRAPCPLVPRVCVRVRVRVWCVRVRACVRACVLCACVRALGACACAPARGARTRTYAWPTHTRTVHPRMDPPAHGPPAHDPTRAWTHPRMDPPVHGPTRAWTPWRQGCSRACVRASGGGDGGVTAFSLNKELVDSSSSSSSFYFLTVGVPKSDIDYFFDPNGLQEMFSPMKCCDRVHVFVNFLTRGNY